MREEERERMRERERVREGRRERMGSGDGQVLQSEGIEETKARREWSEETKEQRNSSGECKKSSKVNVGEGIKTAKIVLWP